MSKLKPLMERNFLEYASYVIIDRAIPDLRDGCKPVQRRILYTLFQMDDGKFHKAANVIGETMKLHPHGDASIGEALVVLANKEYFIEKQGNFGNVITGHSAAAARYIECRLTPLARETLFNKALTHYAPSYDGRKQEPVYLPCKVPALLMLGTEGIAVGMSTRILPHNFVELLEAQIKVLKKQEVSIFPDFLQGGLIDVSEYEDGRGRVKVRAKIEKVSEKKLVIREIPYSTTTSSLIASIESAVQRGKVSVSAINDFTTDKVEIELNTSRGVAVDEIIPQLFAYTDCEVAITSNIVVIKNNHPAEITVSEFLSDFTNLLKKQLKAELEHELRNLEDRRHWLTLEQIFIENRVYKRIEKARTDQQVKREVYTGMERFSDLFVRAMADEDVIKLLDIKIRRISAYDIQKNKDQIDDIVAAIVECRAKLKSLVKTTIRYIRELINKYGDNYSRHSVITSFDSVDKRSVAKADIKVGYDKETGFFGSGVKSTENHQITVSEYDRILAVTSDGTYRIIAPPEKILLPRKLLYCAKFDAQRGVKLIIVYRDERGVAWAKKVHIEKFITDRVYELCRGSKTGIDYLTDKKIPGVIKLYFVPSPRQKINEATYDLKDLKICGIGAKGTRLHSKSVKRMSLIKGTVPPKSKTTLKAKSASRVVSKGKAKSASKPKSKSQSSSRSESRPKKSKSGSQPKSRSRLKSSSSSKRKSMSRLKPSSKPKSKSKSKSK